MVNIFRQAYEILMTKTIKEMLEEEREMVALASSFVANELSRVEPGKDDEPITTGLLKLAVMVDGGLSICGGAE